MSMAATETAAPTSTSTTAMAMACTTGTEEAMTLICFDGDD
jgi:hypothetical protein